MSTTRENLRAAALQLGRKRKTTKKLPPQYRDPRSEPALERVVRLNHTHRRKALGMTTRALADLLGCSQAHVSYMESPKKFQHPNLQMIDALAKALHCTPADLVTPGKFTKTKE